MKLRRSTVESLLQNTSTFSNAEFARQAGLSRQTSSKELRKLLAAGVLRAQGHGRNLRYALAHLPYLRPEPSRRSLERSFWLALTEVYPPFIYLDLSSRAPSQLRTRRQAQSAIDWLSGKERFVLVDLRGIRSMSDAFAHEAMRLSYRD